MSSLLLLAITVIIFVIAYLTYGSWLAKQWGIDPSRKTPAHTLNDGVDYCPAKAPVLLGHHFASIAGAGPINGPIQAAIFGWVPVVLWIVIGGIFFGAMHDFASLFASIRHDGKSIGHVIEMNIGRRGKRLFIVFAWLVLVLVVAAFADIVIKTFAVDTAAINAIEDATAKSAAIAANGSVATASMLFILLSIAFGFFVYRRNMNLGIASVIGVALLAGCIWLGLTFPLHLGTTAWTIVVFAYIFVASITPVWILLQPRDYLNSFLLYAMMLFAFIGVLVVNPTINLAPFTSFTVGGSPMFPILFITVACGAISGFHSLVGSGTTAKQLDNEKDAKLIGYGGMLIECALAIVAIISVGILVKDGALPKGTPPVVFATGVATTLMEIGLPYNVCYTLITLAVSAFALTSLDTATRLGRFMFQEFMVDEGEDIKGLKGAKKVLANPVVATAITVACGLVLAMGGGYTKIWALFGSANQLLAALALLAAAVWLGKVGKNNKMFFIPMIFMFVATLSALAITIVNNFAKFAAGEATFLAQGLQIIFGILLMVLAVILAIEGFKTLASCKKENKSASV